MRQVLFVVAGGTQWDDALRVAAQLDGPSAVLDLGSLEILDPPPPGTAYPGTHWPEQGFRRVWSLVRILASRMPMTGAVVLGQDAGRLQRVAARAAQRASVPVAVVPDGALFDAPATLPARQRVQESVLHAARLTAGEPLRFGATQPDLWCAWGAGWIPLLRKFSPNGRLVVTGSPRAADLARLPRPGGGPPRVLICSQPTWVHPFPPSPTAAARWYAWVDRMVASAPTGAVRVRMHPRERDIAAALPLSEALREVTTTGTSLADDLGLCDAVVAPFSTVLIEAAATGRAVVSVVPEPATVAVRRLSPATADERLAVLLPEEVEDFAALSDALACRGSVSDWGSEFAEISEQNPSRCAAALRALAQARS